MSVTTVLKNLHDAGIQLDVDGDSLQITAAKGKMTAELHESLVNHKASIIAALKLANTRSRKTTGITVRENPNEYPLSAAQKRLWLITQLEADSSAYNVPFVLRIKGSLNVATLEAAINEVVQRHETLRVSFSRVDGQPLQLLDHDFRLKLAHESFVGKSITDLDLLVEQSIKKEISRPFDIGHDALIRGRLLSLAENDYVLVISMHHIASDGWSIRILFEELSEFYDAIRVGRAHRLEPLPIQYADFADWQQRRLHEPDVEGQLAYWREYLRDVSTLEVPLDRPRQNLKGYRGATVPASIDDELFNAIKRYCSREKITLSMLLTTAYSILLHKYSSNDDVVFGTPVANRNHAETENLIGMFVNMLVVRTDLSDNPTIGELSQRVAANAIASYENQDVPFEQIVDTIQPERSPNKNPVFQVTLSLQSDGNKEATSQSLIASKLHLESCEISDYPIDIETTRFDIELHMFESRAGLAGLWIYDTDLFDETSISSMNESFLLVLQQMIDRPGQRVSEINVVSDRMLHRLADRFEQTQSDYPADSNVCELFEAQVEITPQATALSFGEQRLSYQQLNARANQLAHYLQARGVKAETMVAVSAVRSIDMIVSLLGILKAGGAYVPLDPDCPSSRLTYMLEDTAAAVIICHSSYRQCLPEYDGEVLCLDLDWAKMEQQPEHNPGNEARADSLMYVIYTSGSTGVPKGVCVEHRSTVRLVKNTNYIDIKPHDLLLQIAPVAFDASTFEIWGSLLNGAELVVFPHPKISLELLGRVVEDRAITVLWLTTALFNQMIDQQLSALKSVRCLLTGGDVVSVSHVKKYQQFLTENSAGENCILNCYGPTENTTFTTYNTITADSAISGRVPIGAPISNTSIFVLDKNMMRVPEGVIGELYTGGDGLARCYLNQPELSAQKFREIQVLGGQTHRLYSTGDLVCIRQGVVEFVGRIDQQFKLRGFRIEAGEIETNLKSLDEIDDAVVVLDLDREGNKRLVAYLVVSSGDEAVISIAREHLKLHLPDYMVPAVFMLIDEVVLTTNGKVDYKRLPAVESIRHLPNEIVAPQGAMETDIAGVWNQVLDIDAAGVEDNFFDLGGDSFLLIKLHAELEKLLSVDISITDLFRFPTIRSFAGNFSGQPAAIDRHERLQQRVSKQRSANLKIKKIARKSR